MLLLLPKNILRRLKLFVVFAFLVLTLTLLHFSRISSTFSTITTTSSSSSPSSLKPSLETSDSSSSSSAFNSKWILKELKKRPPRKTKLEHSVDTNGYISYLPHSGFCNQRQELENALILAHVLNRTLVLPPFYLGHSSLLSWKPFDFMRMILKLVEIINYNRLFRYSDLASDTLDLVTQLGTVAQVPPTSIFDFSSISHLVRVVHISEFINLDILHYSSDVLQIRDGDRYTYKLIDNVTGSSLLVDHVSNDVNMKILYGDHAHPDYLRNLHTNKEYIMDDGRSGSVNLGEYSHFFNLAGDWSQVADSKYPQISYSAIPKLIQFGSLFGSSRIKLNSREHMKVFGEIRQMFKIKNPVVKLVSADIVDKLGGENAFLAIHLRMGDANFAERSNITIHRTAAAIKKWKQENVNPVVYIATDATDFMQGDLFTPLLEYADIIYSLSNFTMDEKLALFDEYRLNQLTSTEPNGWDSEMSQLIDYADSIMKISELSFPGIGDTAESFDEVEDKFAWFSRYLSNHRSVHLQQNSSTFAKMWIPFIEQEICARSKKFVGTSGSTFSNFISLLRTH